MKKLVDGESGPLLTKLSTFKSTPKWTILRSPPAKEKVIGNSLGPAAYNLTSCINKTSKFRQISYSCSFSTSKRFANPSSNHLAAHSFPGPGAYSPPADYSNAPYVSVSNISFGKGGRMFPKYFYKRGEGLPSPSTYDIRGKHRLGGFTFDPRGVTVNNRHGWFYDADVNACKMNPGPGQYNPRYPNEHHDGKVGFGTGDRPHMYLGSMKDNPSPGAYEVRSKLAGEAHSFATTTASRRRNKDHEVGPLCGQPTQFG